MDVRLADGSGIETTRDIRAKHPATRVLMLTSFADDEALFASIWRVPPGTCSSRSVQASSSARSVRSEPATVSWTRP